MHHFLPATPSTVHWGFFDPRLPPAVVVASGDLIQIETLTHHAGDAPDLLMDDGIAAVFASVTDRGPGPHLLTGPIAVEGARPGDVLQVDILEATPRLPYGSNLAAHWGHLYDVLHGERVTIYELDCDALLGRAVFGYDWTTTPLADQPGTIVPPTPRPVSLRCKVWSSHCGRTSAQWGLRPPSRCGCRRCRRAIMAATSTTGGSERVDECTSPSRWTARCCQWGTHVSQGDGEVSGTALEASLNGLLRVTIRRDLPFTVPVLETATDMVVHGFGDTLDDAMKAAAVRTLDVLQEHFGLTAADAYSFMSVAVDFTVTQVVDQRQGVHGRIDKRCFPSWRVAG